MAGFSLAARILWDETSALDKAQSGSKQKSLAAHCQCLHPVPALVFSACTWHQEFSKHFGSQRDPQDQVLHYSRMQVEGAQFTMPSASLLSATGRSCVSSANTCQRELASPCLAKEKAIGSRAPEQLHEKDDIGQHSSFLFTPRTPSVASLPAYLGMLSTGPKLGPMTQSDTHSRTAIAFNDEQGSGSTNAWQTRLVMVVRYATLYFPPRVV